MNTESLPDPIDEEIRLNRQHAASWMWAVANSGGDQNKTRELYRIRRQEQLAQQASATAARQDELCHLRAAVRRDLALRNRPSIYSVLGIAPDASDQAVAETIARVTASGPAADPEVRYAIEVLGNAESRERYDRTLHAQLSRPVADAAPAAQIITTPVVTAPTTPRLTSWLGIGLLLLVGTYIVLDYKKAEAERELKRQELEARAALAERQARLNEQQAELRAAALQRAAQDRERELDARDRARADAIARDDRMRLESEIRRQQQEQERQKQIDENKRRSEIAAAEAAQRRSEAEAVARTRALRQQMINEAIANGNPEQARRLRIQQSLY